MRLWIDVTYNELENLKEKTRTQFVNDHEQNSWKVYFAQPTRLKDFSVLFFVSIVLIIITYAPGYHY